MAKDALGFLVISGRRKSSLAPNLPSISFYFGFGEIQNGGLNV